MSGGHFNGSQWSMINIAEDIEHLIENEHNIPCDIVATFKQVASELKTLKEKVRAIDYYISGDYGEDSFREAYKDIK